MLSWLLLGVSVWRCGILFDVCCVPSFLEGHEAVAHAGGAGIWIVWLTFDVPARKWPQRGIISSSFMVDSLVISISLSDRLSACQLLRSRLLMGMWSLTVPRWVRAYFLSVQRKVAGGPQPTSIGRTLCTFISLRLSLFNFLKAILILTNNHFHIQASPGHTEFLFIGHRTRIWRFKLSYIFNCSFQALVVWAHLGFMPLRPF